MILLCLFLRDEAKKELQQCKHTVLENYHNKKINVNCFFETHR